MTNAGTLEAVRKAWKIPRRALVMLLLTASVSFVPILLTGQELPAIESNDTNLAIDHDWIGDDQDDSVVTGEGADTPPADSGIEFANGQSRLKLIAGIDFLAVASTKRTFPRGLPLFVLPDSPFGEDTNTFTAHARQSFVNASLSGPTLGDFQVGGNVLAFFQNDNLVADDYGLLVFSAFGELKNEDWRLSAGLQRDVFNPISPTVIYLSQLFASGNAGSYRGQIRLERFLCVNDALGITTQLALSDPLSFLVTDDVGRFTEDNGWPNIEARIEFSLGCKREVRGATVAPVRVGLSSVIGQIRTTSTILAPPGSLPPRSIVDIWGVGTDLQVLLGERSGFVAEFFVGQGLGDYNGGILQTSNSITFDAVRTIGGFAELFHYFDPSVHFHVGYGIDDPNDNDLAATQILRNETYYATLIWDINSSVQFGFEVDYRSTSYTQFLPSAFLDANAVVFGSRLQWRF